MYEKALTILGKKFASACRRKDIPKQISHLKDMATIGRNAKRISSTAGGKVAAEVHWNGDQPVKQEAHIEYWNSFKGQLIPNKWDGIMAQIQDSDGDWICDWSGSGYCTTLDQAINNVPDWLGGTITGELLSNQDLQALITSIIG